MTVAARGFQAEHPSASVQLNFGGSGSLRQQIELGAPVDVFISASSEDVERLARKGKADPETRLLFARNRLVLVGSTGKVSSLEDLATGKVERLSIGDPASVPAGKYARDWLEAEGLWPEVQSKTVLGGDVRQVLDYVQRGEVDAGIVYATDAKLLGLEPIVTASGKTAPEAVYEAVRITAAGRPGLAQRFIEHLGSPEVREALKRAGFVTP